MRIKAEMWDKMQYLFRNYYNRMMHAVFFYDRPLDADRLKESVKYLVDRIPVLHSSFRYDIFRPYWQVREYDIEDVVKVVEEDSDEVREKFLCDTLPTDGNVQMGIQLTPYGEGSALVVIVNHMCMDGGDLKHFLTLLFRAYNAEDMNSVPVKNGTRSYKSVYTKFSAEEKKIAEKLFKNISAVKDKHLFPFTEDREEDITRIVRRKIDADRNKAFVLFGKEHGATVNDIYLAAYFRALYRIGEYDDTERVTVPCMVDLRRHVVNNALDTGFCNHTGFMQCSVGEKGGNFLDTLSSVQESMKVNKEDKYLGLYGLPLLNLAYTYFPHFLSEILIKIGYDNPLLGMSNVGLLKAETFQAKDSVVVDGFMTGAIKYKPYMQLAMTTLNGEVTLTVQERCNESDVAIINRFFDYIEEEIDNCIK